jgi:hypothetical protein
MLLANSAPFACSARISTSTASSQAPLKGTLLGILPDRQQYEFKVGDDGPIIFGPVSEDLDERYLTSVDFAPSILLKPVTAQFLVITKVHGGQIQSQQKVLERITLAGAIKSS